MKKNVPKKSEFKPCADFELAELKKFKANFLEANEPTKRKLNAFILALALIFNDLKGLLWVIERLVEGTPQEKGITAYLGQWSGFNNQYNRLVMIIKTTPL